MKFGLIDYLTLAIYLGVILSIGFFFMKRQKNTAEYFLGSRRIPWFAAAISLFTSLFSSISIISAPGEAYNFGMMLAPRCVLAILGVPLAVMLFVRFFRRLALTTAYEYLERRFNLGVRTVSSFLFLVLRCCYLGVVMYATAIAIQPATGLSIGYGIIIMGAVATAYTSLGGMSSVIWADVFQFIVLVGGIFLVLAILIVKAGGFGEIWAFAEQHDRALRFLENPKFYSFDPFLRITLFTAVVSTVFTKLSLAGADQVNIQRYLSTRGEKQASNSLLWGTLLSIPVMIVLFLIGLGLFWFYHKHPELALENMKGDQALPHFITSQLPVGLRGLVVAAILAASMSTFDAVLNSLATCSITDIYVRIIRPNATEAQKLRLAKILTVFWGVMGILSAAFLVRLYGLEEGRNPLMQLAEVTLGFFGGILLGVFLLGILTRRTNSLGVLVGVIAGLGAALGVTAPYYFRELPPGQQPLSFLWINIIGCVTTVAVGYAASFFGAPPDKNQIAGMTYWDQRKSVKN